jgi:homoserine kinase type II
MAVGRLFGLALQGARPDVPLAGSPERSLARAAVEDKAGRLYVIEALVPDSRVRKTRIADMLDVLNQRGLAAANPYLASSSGEHVLYMDGGYWQIAPFVPGAPLPRPEWVGEAWRGQRLAAFLVDLRRAAQGLGEGEAPFDILSYIATLMEAINTRRPALAREIAPVVALLQQALAPAHDRLPPAFCHGDYHPLNVIWGEGCIEAVIDWEFCGLKPELYDVANLIGCVGVEEPAALTGELVGALLRHLREAAFLSLLGWRLLLPYVLALRFAWLSEWLRKGDEEMIELELTYMRLLMQDRTEIERCWTTIS